MSNSIWNVIITLTSVGYGDTFPKTFFGRIVGSFICFFGVLIVSLFVVALFDKLDFSEGEEKSFTMIIKMHLKHELKIKAVNVLSAGYRYRNTKMNHPKDTFRILKSYRELRTHMINFRI